MNRNLARPRCYGNRERGQPSTTYRLAPTQYPHSGRQFTVKNLVINSTRKTLTIHQARQARDPSACQREGGEEEGERGSQSTPSMDSRRDRQSQKEETQCPTWLSLCLTLARSSTARASFRIPVAVSKSESGHCSKGIRTVSSNDVALTSDSGLLDSATFCRAPPSPPESPKSPSRHAHTACRRGACWCVVGIRFDLGARASQRPPPKKGGGCGVAGRVSWSRGPERRVSHPRVIAL